MAVLPTIAAAAAATAEAAATVTAVPTAAAAVRAATAIPIAAAAIPIAAATGAGAAYPVAPAAAPYAAAAAAAVAIPAAAAAEAAQDPEPHSSSPRRSRDGSQNIDWEVWKGFKKPKFTTTSKGPARQAEEEVFERAFQALEQRRLAVVDKVNAFWRKEMPLQSLKESSDSSALDAVQEFADDIGEQREARKKTILEFAQLEQDQRKAMTDLLAQCSEALREVVRQQQEARAEARDRAQKEHEERQLYRKHLLEMKEEDMAWKRRRGTGGPEVL